MDAHAQFGGCRFKAPVDRRAQCAWRSVEQKKGKTRRTNVQKERLCMDAAIKRREGGRSWLCRLQIDYARQLLDWMHDEVSAERAPVREGEALDATCSPKTNTTPELAGLGKPARSFYSLCPRHPLNQILLVLSPIYSSLQLHLHC